jgi:hypothetical protein
VSILFVEVIASQLFVVFFVVQDMIDDHQNAVSDSHHSLFGSTACGEPSILCGKIGILGVRGGMGRFN